MKDDQTKLVKKINELLKENDLGHLQFVKMQLMPVEDEFRLMGDGIADEDYTPQFCCIVYEDGVPKLKCPCP